MLRGHRGGRRLLLGDRRFGGRLASQVLQDLRGRAITFGRIFLGHSRNDVRQILGNALQHAFDFGQTAVGGRMPHHPGDLAVPTEHAEPGKQRLEVFPAHQFEGGKTERVQVAVRTDGTELVGNHFRRHVLCRSLDDAAMLALEPPGDAKVAELHAAIAVDQQVARFHVAMHDAVLVHELQRMQGVGKRHPQVVQVDRAAAEHRLETALHQLQHQPAAIPHDVVDHHDVRMFERREELGFLPVAFELLGILQELRMDLLDRHVAAQFAVPRLVDGGVVARRDLLDDFKSKMRFHANPTLPVYAAGSERPPAIRQATWKSSSPDADRWGCRSADLPRRSSL